MKTYGILAAFFLFFSLNMNSQTNESVSDSSGIFSAGGDIVSRYIWRGQQLSASPAFQPTVSASLGNFTLGAWGSYTFSAEAMQEADLYLTYTLNNISFTVNDYFNPLDSIEGGYFGWKSGTTRHSLEGVLSVNGPESFPIQFNAGLFFYGNDRDENGKNLYSTYLEVNYTWESGEYSVKPFIGASPFKSQYGNDGFQVINLGVSVSKDLKVSNTMKIPLNVSFITNPNKESVYMVFGLTF
jgi:hypothetical protein